MSNKNQQNVSQNKEEFTAFIPNLYAKKQTENNSLLSNKTMNVNTNDENLNYLNFELKPNNYSNNSVIPNNQQINIKKNSCC